MRSLGILVAMWQELQPLRRAWQLDWTGPGDFFTGRRAGIRLQVALSGVGPGNAQAALQNLLRYGQPELLLSLGYSGALDPQLRPGDCLLASSIWGAQGEQVLSPDWSEAERSDSAWRPSSLLSIDRLAASPASKAHWAQQFPQAQALDMESLVLAKAAQEAGLPWRALRVIIDPQGCPLPIDFEQCCDDKGQTHPGRLARHILTHPAKIPALVQFAGWERQARRSLLACSSRLLEVISW